MNNEKIIISRKDAETQREEEKNNSNILVYSLVAISNRAIM